MHRVYTYILQTLPCFLLPRCAAVHPRSTCFHASCVCPCPFAETSTRRSLLARQECDGADFYEARSVDRPTLAPPKRDEPGASIARPCLRAPVWRSLAALSKQLGPAPIAGETPQRALRRYERSRVPRTFLAAARINCMQRPAERFARGPHWLSSTAHRRSTILLAVLSLSASSAPRLAHRLKALAIS